MKQEKIMKSVKYVFMQLIQSVRNAKLFVFSFSGSERLKSVTVDGTYSQE